MDVQLLIPLLVSKHGYPEHGAKLIAEKLATSSPDIQAAFLEWWNTGELRAPEYEGYTAQRLMEEHHMKPIAALLTLDWLRREPENALKSLSKGHDSIR